MLVYLLEFTKLLFNFKNNLKNYNTQNHPNTISEFFIAYLKKQQSKNLKKEK